MTFWQWADKHVISVIILMLLVVDLIVSITKLILDFTQKGIQ